MATGNVGVVGLGIMGGAMARNLLAGGWRVYGYDTDPKQTAALSAQGVVIEDTAAHVAHNAPYIITSLPGPAPLIDTARVIAQSGSDRRVVIDTSTLALEDKLEAQTILEQAGHVLLDCPVSGTGAQAQAKEIVVYASGDPEVIATLRPLFGGISREMHDVGPFGNGSRMKFVANLLVSIHNIATAEAIVLGLKAGLDPHKVVDVIGAGIGTSRIFDVRAPMMADNNYQPPTAHLSTAHKDFSIISRFAEQIGCPTPLFSATAPIYAAAMARGYENLDPASVCAVLEEMAGIKR